MTLHPLQLLFGTHAAALLHGLPRVQLLQGTLWSLLGDTSGRVNNAETNRTKEQCGEREIKERNVNNLQKGEGGKRKGEKERLNHLGPNQYSLDVCLCLYYILAVHLQFLHVVLQCTVFIVFFFYLHFRSKVCSEYSTFVIKINFYQQRLMKLYTKK